MKPTYSIFKILANVEISLNHAVFGQTARRYHADKGNVILLGGSKVKVTPKGVTFFTNRTRLTPEALAKAAEAQNYTLYDTGEGFCWVAHKKSGAHATVGVGHLGRSLFAYALSDLTQAAYVQLNKAKTKAAPVAKRIPKHQHVTA